MKNLNKSLKVVILKGSHNHLFAEDICIWPGRLQLSYRRKERIRLETKMISGGEKKKKKEIVGKQILDQ